MRKSAQGETRQTRDGRDPGYPESSDSQGDVMQDGDTEFGNNALRKISYATRGYSEIVQIARPVPVT
jgi:hypothetical protein